MTKRQPTFMRSDESSQIEVTQFNRSVRTHVLTKTNSLQGDIASLDDPRISHFYQLLTSELQQPSDPDNQDQGEDMTPIENISQEGVAIVLGANPDAMDVAMYVENITTELKDLCLTVDLKFLSYLLDMARLEASNISTKQP